MKGAFKYARTEWFVTRNIFEKEREKMLAAAIEMEVSVFIEQHVALKTNATWLKLYKWQQTMLQKRDMHSYKCIQYITITYQAVKCYFLINMQISLLLFSFIIFIWLKIKARWDTENKLHVKSKYYVILMLMRKQSVNVFLLA